MDNQNNRNSNRNNQNDNKNNKKDEEGIFPHTAIRAVYADIRTE